MMHRKKAKAEVFQWQPGRETCYFERLRYAAACKLCLWHEHQAGGGSSYVTICAGPCNDSMVLLKLRFADHENTSSQHGLPDYNFVNRNPTEAELVEIENRIQYAKLCKKTAFAMHVGLTVPQLKKLLHAECYDDVCENEKYSNTYTECVVVAIALQTLEAAELNQRIAIRQELHTWEDYCGD